MSSFSYSNDNNDDSFSSCTGYPSYTSNAPLGCIAQNAGSGTFYTSEQCATPVPIVYSGYSIESVYSDPKCTRLTGVNFQKLGVCYPDWDSTAKSMIKYYVPVNNDITDGYFVTNYYNGTACDGVPLPTDDDGHEPQSVAYAVGCSGSTTLAYSATAPVLAVNGAYRT